MVNDFYKDSMKNELIIVFLARDLARRKIRGNDHVQRISPNKMHKDNKVKVRSLNLSIYLNYT